MFLTLDYIKFYMKENNINNDIDSKSFKKSLGILNIDKGNNKIWEIKIKGPKDSLYENGLFMVTIDFTKNFPEKAPEIRIKNKIYNLCVNPNNGHIDSSFLICWDKSTLISEILVGIYLFFIFEQDTNPDSVYSGFMMREYNSNREEFNRKAREWTKEYAQPSLSDLLLIIDLFDNNNSDKGKITELENKNKVLTEKVMKLEKNLKENNFKIFNLSEKLSRLSNEKKLISVIFQSKTGDIHCSIICKETDIFSNVELLLYERYPQYKNSEQYFISNGIKINRYKTLKENGIKDSNIIILNKF